MASILKSAHFLTPAQPGQFAGTISNPSRKQNSLQCSKAFLRGGRCLRVRNSCGRNSGQICTSVDYLWLPEGKVEEFVELAREVVDLLADPAERERRGQRARELIDGSRGALARLLELLEPLLH